MRKPLLARWTRPLNAGDTFPLVVLVHGFGSYKSAMIREYSGRFAEEGFATFAYTLPDHASEPEDLNWESPETHKQQLLRSVLALRSGLDAMALQTGIDMDHIGVIGVGYGGYVALLAAAADTRIDVLVMASAPGDPLTSTEVDYEVDWNRYIRAVDHVAVRRLFSDTLPQAFQPKDVIRLRADCKILLQLGRDDPRADHETITQFLLSANSSMTRRLYDAGILLPDAATGDAVSWTSSQLTHHEDPGHG